MFTFQKQYLVLILITLGLLFSACQKAPQKSEAVKRTKVQLAADFSQEIPADDLYIRALSDELERSIKKLKIEDLERPYFIEYAFSDYDAFDIQASFGALLHAEHRHRRPFQVVVRVGSYQEDNSGFIDQSTAGKLFSSADRIIVADDDYLAIRHDLWKMTDSTYKAALEQLAGKKAYLKHQTQENKIDDFHPEKPVIAIGPRHTVKHDMQATEAMVKRLSGLFKKHPAIQISQVRYSSIFATQYQVTSEGSRIRIPKSIVSLTIMAATQAADGMLLKDYLDYHANNPNELPGDKQIAADIEQMATRLSKLQKAPLLESYTGPVLFEPQAAADLLGQLLTSRLLAYRLPLFEMPQLAVILGNIKENRTGRRLLPKNFQATDEPTLKALGDLNLVSGYLLDEEGIRPQAVEVIKDGKANALLATRTPTSETSRSTGHAFRLFPGFNQPMISNLIIESNQAQTNDQLKAKFVEMIKDQGLTHGLIVRKLDNPVITGFEMDPQKIMSLFMGQGKASISPLLVYRLSPDGKEELVRGLTFDDLSEGKLKDITAAGDNLAVIHRLNLSVYGIDFARFLGPLSNQAGAEAPLTVNTSVVAPAILFEELEFTKSDQAKKIPPTLPHPYFNHQE
jgi:hypothetical protein